MQEYYFILGNTPSLAIAEIVVVLQKQKINFSIKNASEEVLLIESETELDARYLLSILGGVIKLGQVFDKSSYTDNEQKFLGFFSAENLFGKYILEKGKKLRIGFSLYNLAKNYDNLALFEKQLKSLSILVKDNLSQEGEKAGFLKVKGRRLSSVAVEKNKLLNKGAEIVLMTEEKQVLVGKTLAVQEFESFSKRDYGRPKRNPKSGMIPPKLARMMINLAGIEKTDFLLDPFCGSGTIIQEAAVLGYKNLIGTDISTKAVINSGRNIKWFFRKRKDLKKSKYSIEIFQSDVQTLPMKMLPLSIDAVVTEPFLGPPLNRKPKYSKMMKIFKTLTHLYIRSFKSFAKILKKNALVVIVFPCFDVQQRLQFMDILDEIERIGFKKQNLIIKETEELPFPDRSNRESIIYGSKRHFLKREVLVFKKFT